MSSREFKLGSRGRYQELLRGALMVTLPWMLSAVALSSEYEAGMASAWKTWLTACIAFVTTSVYVGQWMLARPTSKRDDAGEHLRAYKEVVSSQWLNQKSDRVFGVGLLLAMVTATCATALHYLVDCSWWWLATSSLPVVIGLWRVARLHQRYRIYGW